MMVRFTAAVTGKLFCIEHSSIVYVCDADHQVYRDKNGKARRDKCRLSVISLGAAGYVVVEGKPEDVVKRIRQMTNYNEN